MRILKIVFILLAFSSSLFAVKKDVLIISGKVIDFDESAGYVIIEVSKQSCNISPIKLYLEKSSNKVSRNFEINKNYFFIVEENNCINKSELHELKFEDVKIKN